MERIVHFLFSKFYRLRGTLMHRGRYYYFSFFFMWTELHLYNYCSSILVYMFLSIYTHLSKRKKKREVEMEGIRCTTMFVLVVWKQRDIIIVDKKPISCTEVERMGVPKYSCILYGLDWPLRGRIGFCILLPCFDYFGCTLIYDFGVK